MDSDEEAEMARLRRSKGFRQQVKRPANARFPTPVPVTLHDSDDSDDFGPRKPAYLEEENRKRKHMDNAIKEQKEESTGEIMINPLLVDVPMSQYIAFHPHKAVISALTWDKTGNRMITGSFDYNIQVYEFNKMNQQMKSLRSKVPEDGHPVCDIIFNRKCDQLLVLTGSPTPHLLSSIDLTSQGQCILGDMYLHDLNHTAGHVSAATCGNWNPVKNDEFITGGDDGTIRIWNVNKLIKNKSVIKCKDTTGRRTAVTSCSYSKDGKYIIGATKNGAIHYWKSTGPFVRPVKSNMKAHENDTDTSCIMILDDNKTVISRGGDGTIKVWQFTKLTLIAEIKDLPNESSQTNFCLSPDGKILITGYGERKTKHKQDNTIAFIRTDTWKRIPQTCIISFEQPVVKVQWHPIINQIIVCAGKQAYMLYDPVKSNKGVLLCADVKKKKKTGVVMNAQVQAYDMDSTKRMKTLSMPTKGKEYNGRTQASSVVHGGDVPRMYNNQDPRKVLASYADRESVYFKDIPTKELAAPIDAEEEET